MKNNYYFLKDSFFDDVDAIIISSSSKKEDVEKAIEKAQEIEGYTWDDLINNLPEDCTIIDRWSKSFKDNVIYY